MLKDKNILIKNIYYMLTYAYQNLSQSTYSNIALEEFDNVQDLFAAILAKGIAAQLKHGLTREYIEKEEPISTLRGKIDITSSIRLRIKKSNTIYCQYDELVENNYFNQILKVTSMLLISSKEVKPQNKAALKKNMLYFSGVEAIPINNIPWKRIRYHRNNDTYRMLINICYLVLNSLLLTNEKGEHYLADLLDDQAMCRLYEKFILEYYRRHHPELSPAPSQIQWNVDDDIRDFLPVMQSDIMLAYKEKILIIDAKYYSKTMQSNNLYNSHTIHSNNLYQIFTYVKNKDIKGTGNVSGMLLYAKTDEQITPNNEYIMGGNRIAVKTLDLSNDFMLIAKQLENIAMYFVR